MEKYMTLHSDVSYVHETAPCPACALTQAHPTMSLHSSHIYQHNLHNVGE